MIPHKFSRAVAAAGILLMPISALSDSITILESFEEGVEGADHYLAEGERRISEFSQSDNNDLGQVTDGDKALKVSFDSLNGWKQDFQLLLSPEASIILDNVVLGLEETPEIGRFFLLYDITWDKLEADAGWANNPLNFGGHGTQSQIEWGGGGLPVTMDWDLGAGLPEGFSLGFEGENGDQTFLRFIFNSNTDLAMDVYVDNIRLLDTKPEGAETEVTLLDSFEESLDALAPTGRVEDEPVLNDDEFYVTHGEKSAMFNLGPDAGWAQDFTIDLEQYEILIEILELPQEERLNYSLAWDWIGETGDGTAGWFQESVQPGGSGLRVTSGWSGNGGTRTRVVNLGLVEWDFPPILTIVHNSNWSGGDMTLYLDNLRLINTAAGPTAPDQFEIVEVERSSDGTVTFSWNSFEGGLYSVESSADIQSWDELDDGVASEGDFTSFTHEAGAAPVLYYRVNQLAQ